MTTPILGLPELESAQSQKYLTVNQALERLDGLVNLTVFNRTQASPPPSSSPGDRYIVAASATGAFTNQENKVALLVGSDWVFLSPSKGWTAYDQGASQHITFDGTSWVNDSVSTGSFSDGSIKSFGINSTADNTNRLSVSSGEVLLNRETDNLTLVMNKEASANDLQIDMQTNFKTKAQIGLISNDDFVVKVSPDGTNFFTGLTVDKDTGNVAIGSGSDQNNKLLVNGSSMLFTNNSGDLRFTFNKGSSNNDVALAFQSRFSSRALIGLLGNDDFTFKVSPDGTTYRDGLVIDKNTGFVDFPLITKFQATMNYRQYIGSNVFSKVDFNTKSYDRADDYDTNANAKVFTVNRSGLHYLSAQIVFSANADLPTQLILAFFINGQMSGPGSKIYDTVLDGFGYSVDGVFNLQENDKIEVHIRFSNHDGYIQKTSTFSGFYIM